MFGSHASMDSELRDKHKENVKLNQTNNMLLNLHNFTKKDLMPQKSSKCTVFHH